ncbi:hypothetical protein FQZ97_831330 [compost metagenome]
MHPRRAPSSPRHACALDRSIFLHFFGALGSGQAGCWLHVGDANGPCTFLQLAVYPEVSYGSIDRGGVLSDSQERYRKKVILVIRASEWPETNVALGVE